MAPIPPKRDPFHGVGQIVRFNWPWYALAAAGNLITIPALRVGLIRQPLSMWIILCVGLADFWLLASLAVSNYIYDHSSVARSGWLDDLPRGTIQEAATFHAGQDEASQGVAQRFPGSVLHVFDFFDPQLNTEPSIVRARRSAQVAEGTIPVTLAAIPLEDARLDLACVVFAAHEIRRADDRAVFFSEVRRVLRSDGRVIVVEHLRDGWNGLAYGPGAFHFLPRRAWLDAFTSSGLFLERELPCTPFVRVFHLKRGQ